jgi:cytochrome c oxidase subunit 4
MSTHNEHAYDPQKEARTYRVTLTLLLILTAVTVAASYIHFESSSVNVVIALTIATMKATLVALFFMHLLHDKPVNAVIAVAGFIFLGLLLMFVLIDIGTRDNLQPANLHAPPAAAASAPATPEGAATPAADKRE